MMIPRPPHVLTMCVPVVRRSLRTLGGRHRSVLLGENIARYKEGYVWTRGGPSYTFRCVQRRVSLSSFALRPRLPDGAAPEHRGRRPLRVSALPGSGLPSCIVFSASRPPRQTCTSFFGHGRRGDCGVVSRAVWQGTRPARAITRDDGGDHARLWSSLRGEWVSVQSGGRVLPRGALILGRRFEG